MARSSGLTIEYADRDFLSLNFSTAAPIISKFHELVNVRETGRCHQMLTGIISFIHSHSVLAPYSECWEQPQMGRVYALVSDASKQAVNITKNLATAVRKELLS